MTHVMPFLFLSVFAKNILIFMYKPRFLWYTINDTNTQGFDRHLSVRASSKDLRIPAYSLRLFPRPGKNPLGQNCKVPVGESFCDDFCCGERRNIPIFRGGQCKKSAQNIRPQACAFASLMVYSIVYNSILPLCGKNLKS